MKSRILVQQLAFSIVLLANTALAQYHTLPVPGLSPEVQETQQLGVCQISIRYSAPAVRGRGAQIWSEEVPVDGKPVMWRAGANMNTQIAFTTPVYIEGYKLPAGSYGIHMIPRQGKPWTVVFANNDNLWGSYYYNAKTDSVLAVQVMTGTCTHREYLSYEFQDRADSSVTIALEWEQIRVPIRVHIDFVQTTLARFRYELRGQMNMNWASWNAAAQWCLQRKVNYTEALEWANRSISGGFGGYMATSNVDNLGTKYQLLLRMQRSSEAQAMLPQLSALADAVKLLQLTTFCITEKANDMAHAWAKIAMQRYPSKPAALLAMARYHSRVENDTKKATVLLQEAVNLATDDMKPFFQQQLDKATKGERI